MHQFQVHIFCRLCYYNFMICGYSRVVVISIKISFFQIEFIRRICNIKSQSSDKNLIHYTPSGSQRFFGLEGVSFNSDVKLVNSRLIFMPLMSLSIIFSFVI